MTIPEPVEEKLDSDPSWAVQHEDVIQVMDEARKEKPWSRYMIQQHLDGDPAKKTVQDRLDELVELEVLDKYEYSNQTLYDLAYDPIITDGGRLQDASLVELATFQDEKSLRDLAAGAIFISIVLFGIGVLTENTSLASELALSGNFYIDSAVLLYVSGFCLIFLLRFLRSLKTWVADLTQRGA